MEKEESIERLMQMLEQVLEPGAWRVVDHWEADLCAIGIAREDNPRRLVYISMYGMEPGRYYYECEEPTGEPLDAFRIVKRDRGVDFDELVKVIRGHVLGGGARE